VLALSLAALAAPAGAQVASPEPSPLAGSVTLYTSVTQDTVDAVLAALAEQQPGLSVEVFRAPTGELDARIASELRSGGIGADVLGDRPFLQRYDAEGMLATLEGEAFEAVPPEYRTDTFVGTRLLNLVIVAGQDLEPKPVSWADLADPAYAGGVAIPDPGFAGSAFAALGYFASDGMGLDYYQRPGTRRHPGRLPGGHRDRRGRGSLPGRHLPGQGRARRRHPGLAHRAHLARTGRHRRLQPGGRRCIQR
jgi:iron(III) transport system substrate-binding protein